MNAPLTAAPAHLDRNGQALAVGDTVTYRGMTCTVSVLEDGGTLYLRCSPSFAGGRCVAEAGSVVLASADRFLVETSRADFRTCLPAAGRRAAHEAALGAMLHAEGTIVRVYAAARGPRKGAPLAVYAWNEAGSAVIARHPAGQVLGSYNPARVA